MKSPVIEEQEPGVYVRSHRPEHELDFLWDRERKKGVEYDRFHLGFFAGGAVVGSLVTLVACMLFFSGGSLLPIKGASEGAVVTEKMLQPSDLQKAAAQPQAKQAMGLPFFSSKPETPKTDTENAQPVLQTRSYTVASGDTLGSIAIKFYDSSNPKYIEKIRRANKMADADTLSLGQRLVIPPKDY